MPRVISDELYEFLLEESLRVEMYGSASRLRREAIEVKNAKSMAEIAELEAAVIWYLEVEDAG